ncbi:MAG: exonuclease SbcCD subunit D [Pirellulaceae bacterium]
MSGQSFRFLHASDFHLEEPLGGLAEVPPHLGELFLDAPYTAAERVFDTAVRERVDFVILSGDLLEPTLAGPRGISFLLNQFERLNTHGIAVYWAGGKCDGPQDWPNAAKLPSNVQVFPGYKCEELTHLRGEKAIACIVGRSWHGSSIQAADYAVDAGNLFSIGVGFGPLELGKISSLRVDYWAMGGRHERQSIGGSPIYYPGTPQGRSRAEFGPHGCTLVHVADDQTFRTQFIPIDAARWLDETVQVEEGETRTDVKRRIAERMKQLLIDAVERPLLVHWNISLSHRLGSVTKCREWGAELLEWLRTEFGSGKAPVYTLAVETGDEQPLAAEWFVEESMLGDFLKVMRSQDSDDAIPLDLLPYVPERARTTTLAAIASWNDTEKRSSLLREAAHLGARLLGAEERV